MTLQFALSPIEAAYIAANVYFTLEGWEATYKFRLINGNKAKAEPKPRPGLASQDIIKNNVTGAGSLSVNKAGIHNSQFISSLQGSTGTNLPGIGRTKSGFGYLLQFERGGKHHLVIATRGTRPEMGYADLLTDVNISSNRNMPGAGPIHSGFFDTYNSIKPQLATLQTVIEQADIVHCVGHSLGGAVANLVAIHCAQLGAEVKLYTFGAPRVGLNTALYDKVLANYLGEENIFRVSHSLDPIPMIPVAPYIHVLPSIKDAHNFFIGSPINSISLENHDTANYIRSVEGKEWQDVHSSKLKEGYLNKQYFNQWRASESWLKQAVGASVNSAMSLLQRIFQGLIETIGVGAKDVATLIDLLVVAIERGVEIFQISKSYIAKFLSDCAKMFGFAVEVSREILIKLLRKLKVELALAAKMALATAGKFGRSTEFKIILAACGASSIGCMLL
jgi:triacylglycerol lipase